MLCDVSRSLDDAVGVVHRCLTEKGLRVAAPFLEEVDPSSSLSLVEQVKVKATGTSVGYAVYQHELFECRVSYLSSAPGVVQVVELNTGSGIFHGSSGQEILDVLTTLAVNLHRALGAARTIFDWGLADCLRDYDWQEEWCRLSRGEVVGYYWADHTRAELVSPDRERELRSRGVLKRIGGTFAFRGPRRP